MRWTPEQYAAYTAKQNRNRDSGLPAPDQKPTQGQSLERTVSGKSKSSACPVDRPEPPRRTRIKFTIYAVRPCDWDNWSIKECQDLLIKAGILHGDDWHSLQGEIVSEKVHSKDEERTVIEIEQP